LAAHCILAVDNSKFGKRALVRLASLRQIDSLVTDQPPQPSLHQRLEGSGVTLHMPPNAG
jgi:DeoR family glycerol-3-phosphate regulon repressor